MERYLRQFNIPQIGAEGQRKLAEASILVVGAGGLGCGHGRAPRVGVEFTVSPARCGGRNRGGA